MGFVGSKKNRKYLKFKPHFPGGHTIVESEILYLDKDSLIIQEVESATSSGNIYHFYKKYTSKTQNLKPDW
jgi:hypothetical protein